MGLYEQLDILVILERKEIAGLLDQLAILDHKEILVRLDIRVILVLTALIEQ
jgi:hypothetical protein